MKNLLNHYELIRVVTKDQLKLHGLYQAGDKHKSAVILIHGFTGDFFSHDFYHTIAQKLAEQNHALILAQTRGTGLHTEFIKSDRSGVYIGSFAEKIEDAHIDISAYIKFLKKEGYTSIVLAGHSLGTIKVVRYLFEGEYKDDISRLILLSPFDKNVFMHIKGEGNWDKYLSVAKDKNASGHGTDLVPVPEWEDYPLSYETFYSWYNKSPLSCIWDFYKQPFHSEILTKIKIPVRVILGEYDEFTNYPQYNETSRSVLSDLDHTIKDYKSYLVIGANHTYDDHAECVSNQFATFLVD